MSAPKSQVEAYTLVLRTLVEAIREHPSPFGMPEGELYVILQSVFPCVSLDRFRTMVGQMVALGLVTSSHHCLKAVPK